MKDENIFSSDSFSENNMPLITVIGKLLDQVYFNQMSKPMSQCVSKNSNLSDEFYDSLNESQREMFEKLELVPSQVSQIDINEHFNRGFVFGAVIMTEILSVIHLPKHQL